MLVEARMKILAPAKVNLYLRVVGKRRDGYHLIDSLMVPVSLYDEIEITKLRTTKSVLTVTCDDPIVPVGKKNLASTNIAEWQIPVCRLSMTLCRIRLDNSAAPPLVVLTLMGRK